MLRQWVWLALVLISAVAAFVVASHRFGYEFAVRDMPVLALSFALVATGSAFLLMPRIVRASSFLAPAATRQVLTIIVVGGLVARLLLLASEPVLEDDYQRYLWDGAVTAQGLNPYTLSPEQAQQAPAESAFGALATRSDEHLERVNHSRLRTVYPPVAQGAFAVAHWLGPWSLTAWRLVCLGLEIATLALLLMLLRDAGRSPLWAAIYWWNPIALKEIANSAHMEAVVLPLVLGALVLANRRRYSLATVSLLFAAGAKLWPALLLPLIWRPLLREPLKLASLAALSGCAFVAILLPFWLAGLDQSSGLIAYAQDWKTNSALTPLLENVARQVLAITSAASVDARLAARLVAGAVLAGVVYWQLRAQIASPNDLLQRVFVIITWLFLLSPAQFPWYYLWLLPLLTVFPLPGLLVLSATLPLYYMAFHFIARDQAELFAGTIVWAIWLPAWLLLAGDVLRRPAWTSRYGNAVRAST